MSDSESEGKNPSEHDRIYSYVRKNAKKPIPKPRPRPQTAAITGAYLTPSSRTSKPQENEVVSPLETSDSTEQILTSSESSSTPAFSLADEENRVVEIMKGIFQEYQETIEDIIANINSKLKPLKLQAFKQPMDLKSFCGAVIPALLPALRVPDFGMIQQFSDIFKLEKNERDLKDSELAGICSNFVELATRYGEIIVSEKQGVTKYSKSIKVSIEVSEFSLKFSQPVKVGGIAGGDKFVVK
jgi:hypothetical protein